MSKDSLAELLKHQEAWIRYNDRLLSSIIYAIAIVVMRDNLSENDVITVTLFYFVCLIIFSFVKLTLINREAGNNE